MAIERALTKDQTEIRAALPAAYTKVHDVEMRLTGETGVWIHVLTFADAEARRAPGAVSVNKETEKCSLADFIAKGQPTGFSVDEVKAAAYRYLKTVKRIPNPILPPPLSSQEERDAFAEKMKNPPAKYEGKDA